MARLAHCFTERGIRVWAGGLRGFVFLIPINPQIIEIQTISQLIYEITFKMYDQLIDVVKSKQTTERLTQTALVDSIATFCAQTFSPKV